MQQQPPPPATIGRYEVHEELGRGAMGVVRRAVDTVIGRTVAIKMIRLDSLGDDAERQRLKDRLMREARSAGSLSHPNIVTVFDAGEERGIAYIAMEFVPGATLEQILRDQGKVPREQLARLLTQAAAALDYAHEKGVVHRDIKPGNIMIASADGVAKITDFGVAKMISHQATQSDLVLGTPNYMAPEQIESRAVDGRTDQFALAVIAYELLTGERPFHGESLPALALQIARETPPAPHLLNPALNERVTSVVLRALAKQPAERFNTCTAFVRALLQSLAACGNWQPLARAAAATMATVAVPAVPPPPPLPPPATIADLPSFAQVEPDAQHRASGRTMGVLLVLACLAAGAYAYWQWSGAEPATETAAVTPPPPVIDESRPRPVEGEVVTPPVSPVSDAPTSTAAPIPPAPPAAPAAAPAAGPQSGVVEFESTPPGATVTIDNTRDQCKTPCSLELSQGRHVLTFKLDGHRNGTLVITVPQEEHASLRLDPLSGTLMISTTPAGAQILIDGAAREQTTPATLRLPPGKHRVTLKLAGRADHTQEVEVRDEAITQVDFEWKP
ncbi:MAG: protein kinase [Bryobacterales bacterium]|nr:protein kinase [Bryobacterales bacterium]